MSARERLVIIAACIMLFGAILMVNVYLEEREQKNVVEYGKMENASENATLYNIWLVDGQEKELTALVDGTLCTFPLKKKTNINLGGMVADLQLKNGVVQKIMIKEDTIEGKVLSITEKTIEVERYGELPIGRGFKVYKTYMEEMAKGAGESDQKGKSSTASYDKVKQVDWENILVGYDNTAFVVADGKVCAGLILKPAQIKDIRVMITNSNQSGEYHDRVEVTSDKNFSIEYGKESKKYKKGKNVVLSGGSEFFDKKKTLHISAEDGGKITLLSLKRNQENPAYRGTIEVRKKENGLLVINELPVEEYLYGVIGSEMPISYGPEALKVQAVCARSYAYRHFTYSDCGEFGAHVDDTVAYQVYNNNPESKETIQAVDDTKGMVMVHNGEIINAYYFSTSCGHTASAKDVWQGSVDEKYLCGRVQNDKGHSMDLENEKSFETFIKNKKFDSFDREFSWYRWEVTLSKADITEGVDKNLSTRYKKNKDLILTKNKKGKYVSTAISSVGAVKDIKVVKRGVGGVVKELEIIGTDQTIKVLSEYNVRLLLNPSHATITRMDKSKVDGMSMLPSGFFTIKKEEKNGNTAFRLYGGGYGHGVGMSQNGAKVMAEQGYSYQEILEHYYPGVTLQVGLG